MYIPVLVTTIALSWYCSSPTVVLYKSKSTQQSFEDLKSSKAYNTEVLMT